MVKKMLIGDGTKEKPYVIKTPEDLQQISKHLSSHFVLASDITLDGEFSPIGNQFEPFSGVFGGQNHCVFSISIQTQTQYVGLFAYNIGTIKNLRIENANILAVSCVGTVAGFNEGTVENCFVSGTVSATCHVGAVVGFNNGKIENCKSAGDVFETSAFLGDKKSDLELFVSPNGSEQADGSKENPFGSIEAAKNTVRHLIHQGFLGNITVFLREGIYYIEKQVEFNEEDCFSDSYHIVYTAYNNENVHLVGGKVISNWEKTKHGLQRAFVGAAIDCKYLCVDGRLKICY